MDIRELRIFITISQEESLTKASRLLYMTPQGLSKIVKNLEDELSCPLFLRTSGGVKLTECGERLLTYAKQAVSEYESTKNDILHLQQKHQGIVDLLSAYGILRLVTPDCITSFKEKYPDITFIYREYPDLQVERLFLKKNGNIAFSIAEFDPSLYNITELETFPIKLLVNESHPLSLRSSVTINDLRQEKLYIESSQFKIHHIIMNKCHQAGFTPDIAFETSGFSLCHKMVKANKGVSVTVDFVFDDMKENGLKLIPFSDGPYEWKMCMLTRKGELISDAVSLFCDHVMDWISMIKEGRISRS